MAVQLKDTLRCLCVEIGWSYAVFWKVVRRHNQMHLVWEDGHCERPPDAPSMEFKAIDLLQNSRGGLFAELGCQELGSLAYKMMSTQVHVVGDGIVGQAALTGNHRWILWDAHNDYGSVPKGLAEMNHQFSAGIQTIAIIPVLPHGVVQLGSTQMVMENMEFIHHLRSRFAQLICVPQALDSRSLNQPCSLISQLYGNTSVNSSTAAMMPTIHPVLEPILHHHRQLESESVGALVVSSSREVRATENASSQNIKGIYNFDPLQGLDKRTSPDPVWSTSGNDLSDLLGLSNKSGCYDANAHELSVDFSTCLTHLDMGPFFDALNDDIYSNPDQLLDAVVAQINASGKDDNVSCKTSSTNISSSIHTSSATCGWVGSVEQMHGECVDLSPMLVKPEAICSSSVISACSMDKTGECPQRDPGYKSQISSWVENGQSVSNDSISATHSKGMDEVGKLNRKRARPGHNPRPRPKDRQMIQDRVKELREIVPNGAKCSIDTLLEKTIKHMLFLQSVTKHADKLKEVGEPKIVSKEGGLLLKDNFEGGATWAFEVGTQSMICPIIVEDLNLPRQMLVEMLCEQQDLFLEIADLIRGLGLTILKGVMEARNSKVWARFAVEANRDVTRMEIFLSLVRLLEPNAGSNMMPQGAESLNIPQHNMLHPSSIPATGLADCLR